MAKSMKLQNLESDNLVWILSQGVSFTKLFNYLEPQFSHLQIRSDNPTYRILEGIK